MFPFRGESCDYNPRNDPIKTLHFNAESVYPKTTPQHQCYAGCVQHDGNRTNPEKIGCLVVLNSFRAPRSDETGCTEVTQRARDERSGTNPK
jgi:hypothetical protein